MMNAGAKVAGLLLGWRGYAAAVVVGAIAAGGAAWTVQAWRYTAQLAEMRADHAEKQAAQATTTVAALEAVRNEERRRMAALEIARDDAQKQAAAAAADAAGARDERDRLRARANTLARAAVARDPTLADGSPSGAAAVDLLAYMLGRVSERAAELAGIADRARITGLTCERAYDSLGVRP
ncbi:DUF2514 family protein [Achromobacter sp. 2789STDY5608615]|uniref:DUF2514 family protein n=1 Tax=Achromobacter sp. 2789STDY5608615 TaxID=1806492 RepID=UPI000AE63AC1|nr:DUF2514 family protein [Achromobacter sp. 2789STDY5608615]